MRCASTERESHTPRCCSVPRGDGYCSAFNSSFIILSATFVKAKREALKTCHSETRIKAESPRRETTMTPTPVHSRPETHSNNTDNKQSYYYLNLTAPIQATFKAILKCRHRQTFYVNAPSCFHSATISSLQLG